MPNEPNEPKQTEPAPVALSEVELPARDWPRPWMAEFLRALSGLGNVTAAAQVAGISTEIANAHRNGRTFPDGRVKQHPTPGFSEAWAEAWERSIDLVEQWVRRAASPQGIEYSITRTRKTRDAQGNVIAEETTVEEGTTRSNQAALRLLAAERPEKWAQRQEVRHGGLSGAPVKVIVERAPTRERMLELAALARQYELPETIDGEILDEDDDGSANGDGSI